MRDSGDISQNLLNERLRAWAQPCALDKHEIAEKKIEFVETLEFVMYLICTEEDVTPENFTKIFSNKGSQKQFLKVFGDDKKLVDIETLIAFVMETTNNKEIEAERLEKIQYAFLSNFGREKSVIGYEEFKTVFPFKDDFFVKRLFQLFDTDQSNSVSIAEFCETINTFYNEGNESKLEFLFYIYDVNENGKLCKENFQEVIKACMKESGMKLEDEKIMSLADVLFEDGVREGQNFMTLKDFKEQFYRQEGLLNNLNMIIDKLITPKEVSKSKSLSQKMLTEENMRYFTWEYWSNNAPLIITILAIVAMMVAITIQRFVYFRHMTTLSGFTPNLFYMFSRATGKNILALSVIVIMLVLRHTITLLRNLGLGRFLPLDNNLYLHKLVGTLIFVLGLIHSLCHFLNFGLNIQPAPLQYLLMTFKYWEVHFGGREEALAAYQSPPGCQRLNETEPDCRRPDGLDLDVAYGGVWLCEVCGEGEAWSLLDWLLSRRPGLFGLLPGVANPTGIGLLITIVIIFACSLPYIRRRGHFEIFYFSHYLYLVYYVLLILHAPEFWKFFLPVGVIWLGERLYRLLHSSMGKGKTSIEEGVVLPSRVTNLIIKRPANFAYSPGDWVFVRIPRSLSDLLYDSSETFSSGSRAASGTPSPSPPPRRWRTTSLSTSAAWATGPTNCTSCSRRSTSSSPHSPGQGQHLQS